MSTAVKEVGGCRAQGSVATRPRHSHDNMIELAPALHGLLLDRFVVKQKVPRSVIQSEPEIQPL